MCRYVTEENFREVLGPGQVEANLMVFDSEYWSRLYSRKNGARVRENERGVYCGLVVGKRARVLGCSTVNTCTTSILENLSMAAQMEGNYSMTLKMGLEY